MPFKSPDPKIVSRVTHFNSCDTKFKSCDTKFKSRDSKFGSRDSTFVSPVPNFKSHDPKIVSWVSKRVHRPWSELLNIPAPDSLNLKMPAFSNKEANSQANNLRMDAPKFLAKNFGFKLVPDKEVDEFQTYLNHELNKAVVCYPTKANKADFCITTRTLFGNYSWVFEPLKLIVGHPRCGNT